MEAAQLCPASPAVSHWGKYGISAFGLKVNACTAMLVDHINYILYNPYRDSIGIPDSEVFTIPSITDPYSFLGFIMGVIGRLALPIFAFQIAEGYCHTRNKWAYFGRLMLFALISETAFDFGFFGTPFYWQKQNVFFTLALGLLAVILFDEIMHADFVRWKWLKVTLGVLAVIVCGIIAMEIRSDYSFMGVMMIFIFYILQNRRILRDAAFSGMVLLPLMQAEEGFAVLDVPLFHLYNGKKGYSSKAAQIGFYAFYPVHIALLGGIKILLGL